MKGARAVALLEVLVAFALVHVAFRAFRSFTSLGRSEVEAGLVLGPGVVMLVAAVALIVLRRERFADYGLGLRGAGQDARAGLVALVLVLAAGAALLPLGLERAPARIGPDDARVCVPVALGVGLLLLVALDRGLPEKLPRGVVPAVLVVAFALPVVAAAWAGSPLGPRLLALAALAVGAVGEEAFFRGYVQTRLDHAWGTPVALLGARFGVGIVVASLLFGLVHALNPTDYFAGEWRVRPWHGLVTAVMPYGLLRARTGGIVGAAVLHALLNLAVRMPALL